MSFQVLINVAFFCFGGRREDEGGWPIRRCDLIPARFDMWPIGLHVFALSLSLSPPLTHLVLTCSPAPTPLGDDFRGVIVDKARIMVLPTLWQPYPVPGSPSRLAG